MKPYYEDGNATLYLGDAREVLPALTAGSSDLLLTDPPYDIGFKSNRGQHDRIAGDDGTLDIRAVLAAACRVLRRSRHAYVFGPSSVLPEMLTAGVELVWDKGIVGMGDLSVPWGRSHEPISFALHQPSKANREQGFGRLTARIRQGTVLRVDRTHGASSKRHPTEKPVLLLRQLIESSSVMGDMVLDPFAGVGSTLVAATLEGRRSVGIEIEERYCEIAAKRLSTSNQEDNRG